MGDEDRDGNTWRRVGIYSRVEADGTLMRPLYKKGDAYIPANLVRWIVVG